VIEQTVPATPPNKRKQQELIPMITLTAIHHQRTQPASQMSLFFWRLGVRASQC
jgi:hypothetical protein